MILIGFDSQHRLNWLASSTNAIFTPLRYPFVNTKLTLVQDWDFLKDLPHQERLIKDLKRRLAELAISSDKLAQATAENEVLRQALKISASADRHLLPAKVISLSRFALINQGTAAGVEVGQAVVSQETIFGVVSETQAQTAKIALLNDPSTKLDARTASGTTGQLSYDGSLQFGHVLQKEDLKEEEPIFTKGTELIADGLLIGTIKKINQNQTNVYKSATVEPALTLLDSQTVLVILN